MIMSGEFEITKYEKFEDSFKVLSHIKPYWTDQNTENFG
jgi:hypothetical protein